MRAFVVTVLFIARIVVILVFVVILSIVVTVVITHINWPQLKVSLL